MYGIHLVWFILNWKRILDSHVHILQFEYISDGLLLVWSENIFDLFLHVKWVVKVFFIIFWNCGHMTCWVLFKKSKKFWYLISFSISLTFSVESNGLFGYNNFQLFTFGGVTILYSSSPRRIYILDLIYLNRLSYTKFDCNSLHRNRIEVS